MKRILCIADCCCDLIFGGLSKLPKPGEEVFGTHFSMQAGGGANTAILLGRSGVPTAFWTQLGDDLAGRIVEDAIVRSGVLPVLHESGTRRTPVSAVLSTDTDRAFASFAEPNDLLADAEALKTAIANADIVHTYLGYLGDDRIPALCERYGVLLSADTSFCDARPEFYETILPRCDYWKGNETEAKLLTGKEDAAEALALLADRVKKGAVVTLGKKGSIGRMHGGNTVEQPAVDCGPFRDACGAGDAFAAGMLIGIARNDDFPTCLKRGAQLSGRVVTVYGGCPETLDFSDG